MLEKAINVFWACPEKEWMYAKEPDKISDIFYSRFKADENPYSHINRCPSFNGSLKNLFALRSLYNYNFQIVDNNLISNLYNQEFFNSHITIRSINQKFFSFSNKFIFFTDEPSLNVTFYEYPFLEDNNITQRCMIPSGMFDIGKWFRPTEFAFFLKKDFNEFKIERNEIYSYMRFHTKNKINFKQFRFNSTFVPFITDGLEITNFNLKTLENFYSLFKNKKFIIKEIKNNLIN